MEIFDQVPVPQVWKDVVTVPWKEPKALEKDVGFDSAEFSVVVHCHVTKQKLKPLTTSVIDTCLVNSHPVEWSVVCDRLLVKVAESSEQVLQETNPHPDELMLTALLCRESVHQEDLIQFTQGVGITVRLPSKIPVVFSCQGHKAGIGFITTVNPHDQKPGLFFSMTGKFLRP